jgi:hypothetical protein
MITELSQAFFLKPFWELLWYDSTVEPKGLLEFPLVKYFEDLGLVVIKSG